MQTIAQFFWQFAAVLGGMTGRRLVFFLLFAAIWLVGANILFALHYKRMGRPWHEGLRLLAFPLRDFNTTEWLILLALAAVSVLFGFLAIVR